MATVDLVKRERNTKHFSAGDIIFAEGDPDNDCFYVLEEGEVEIANQKKFLETIRPGGFFGEMGLVNNKPRSATATAKTDCRLVVINEGDFYFMIQHSPFFAIEMMQVLSERVRRNTEA
jgi:CRP/FNR family transcriptional regulator, cyclic AMP receptor protein